MITSYLLELLMRVPLSLREGIDTVGASVSAAKSHEDRDQRGAEHRSELRPQASLRALGYDANLFGAAKRRQSRIVIGGR